MQMKELHILRSLRGALDGLPDNASERDSRFAVEASNAAITAMIHAEEPVNKTETYQGKAQRIAESLQAFIEHRNAEQWSEDTTYRCTLCPMGHITTNLSKNT